MEFDVEEVEAEPFGLIQQTYTDEVDESQNILEVDREEEQETNEGEGQSEVEESRRAL